MMQSCREEETLTDTFEIEDVGEGVCRRVDVVQVNEGRSCVRQ